MGKEYLGEGRTIEEALQKAQTKIPLREGTDIYTSIVIRWGLRRGGFTNASTYYVVIEEVVTAGVILGGK